MAASAEVTDDIRATAAICRAAALGDGRDLPLDGRDSRQCFDLLRDFPADRAGLARLSAKAAALGLPKGRMERHLVLRAFDVALARLPLIPAEDSVKRLFCRTCRQVAAAGAAAGDRFHLKAPTFYQLARVATLNWLPAGEYCFEFTALPRSWLLKMAPMMLPEVIRELVGGFGSLGPAMVTTHLWSWRSNPFLVLPSEHERALWRIAETMRLHPRIAGLMADGWFCSPDIAAFCPHLAWVREFFLARGAMLVDMGPAPADSGFLDGSARRRQLYRDGKLRPRMVLVLWRRAAMLSWAEGRVDLVRDCRAVDPQPPGIPPAAASTAAEGRRSWLDRSPKSYAAATILAPALVVLAAFLVQQAWWSAIPACLATAALMWILQYAVNFR